MKPSCGSHLERPANATPSSWQEARAGTSAICGGRPRRGHAVTVFDFRTLAAGVNAEPDPFPKTDAIVVRTMPPGSLEQVVFRMDYCNEPKRVASAC